MVLTLVLIDETRIPLVDDVSREAVALRVAADEARAQVEALRDLAEDWRREANEVVAHDEGAAAVLRRHADALAALLDG